MKGVGRVAKGGTNAPRRGALAVAAAAAATVVAVALLLAVEDVVGHEEVAGMIGVVAIGVTSSSSSRNPFSHSSLSGRSSRSRSKPSSSSTRPLGGAVALVALLLLMGIGESPPVGWIITAWEWDYIPRWLQASPL